MDSQRAPMPWTPRQPFRRALVIVAHPDDAEFGGAATVARWVQAGTEVRYLVLTDGAAGSPDPQMTRDRLRDLREQEQRAACERLGVADVTFLRHADGFLVASPEVRRSVAAEIRRHRPDVVITTDPMIRYAVFADGPGGAPGAYVNHPDHRAAGDLVLDCVNPAASSRLWDLTLLEEGLEPWKPAEVWLMSFRQGIDLVDITATFADKVAALRCHASQLGDWDPEPMLRDWARQMGARIGVGLAEPFTILRFHEIEEDVSPTSA